MDFANNKIEIYGFFFKDFYKNLPIETSFSLSSEQKMKN